MVLATYLVFRGGKAVGQGALITQGLSLGGGWELTKFFGPPRWLYSEDLVEPAALSAREQKTGER